MGLRRRGKGLGRTPSRRRASPGALVGKSQPASARPERCGLDPRAGKIPWRRAWQPTPVFLPGESRGQRSLVGYRHGVAKSRTQLSNLEHRPSRRKKKERPE